MRWSRLFPNNPAVLPASSGPGDAGLEALTDAPVSVLLLDAELNVRWANLAAKSFFDFGDEQLPQSLIVLTRELRLEEAARARNGSQPEVRLVHRPSTLQLRGAAWGQAGDHLLFLSDITELRRLQTVRQEFVANLSHELLTPITSLRMAAETLGGDLPAADRLRFAERVLQESDRLAAIIDNLRQLAEIESGHPVVRRSRVEVEELLREIVIRSHLGSVVTVRADPTLVVEVDREKLAQAAGNLLDNAGKFSPADSSIELEVVAAGGELVVTVRDHGPGISPEHWDRVFERFYKVDPARSRDIPGTGLGLAITKHLVLLMGGRVWTEAGEGGGQVFGLAVPVASEAGPAPAQ